MAVTSTITNIRRVKQTILVDVLFQDLINNISDTKTLTFNDANTVSTAAIQTEIAAELANYNNLLGKWNTITTSLTVGVSGASVSLII